MIQLIHDIFDHEQCSQLISFCEACDVNEIIPTSYGAQSKRYHFKEQKKIHFYRMHEVERKPFVESVQQVLPDYTVSSWRVMKYETGGWLQPHKDLSFNSWEGSSTHSLNVMLSDPLSFTGGEFFIGDPSAYVEFQQGSGLLYDYSHTHEVKKIKSGVRWIVNIRLIHAGSSSTGTA